MSASRMPRANQINWVILNEKMCCSRSGSCCTVFTSVILSFVMQTFHFCLQAGVTYTPASLFVLPGQDCESHKTLAAGGNLLIDP